MKILFLAEWYPNKFDAQNGVFVRKHALAASQYCEVNVLYTQRDTGLKQSYLVEKHASGNLTEWVVYFKGSNFKLLNICIVLWLYWKMIAIIRQEKGMENLEHIHITGKKNAVVTLLLWWRNKIPYIITEHWTGYMNRKFSEKKFNERFFVRLAVKNAGAITTVSEQLKNAMLKLGLKNDYYIIPNVVESSLPVKPQRKDNTKKFLTVSDLVDENKNISGTIRAVSNIANKRTDFEFHIIGGGQDEEALKRLAGELNLLNTKIFFHGRQANEYVLDFMNEVDFVVINSNVETFSVVAAEALASGKPVIATISGGPEDFINAQTGILIEKRKNSQLEAAILKMLDEYKNFDREVLRKSVIEKFGAESIGKKFYDLYSEVINNQ